MYFANSGISIAFRKILYTFAVIVGYTMIYNISYPGTYNINFLDVSGGYGYLIKMTSIMSQSTRPYIVSNIIMNMLVLIFPYFENMQKDTDTRYFFDRLNFVLMIAISITYSIISYGDIDILIADEFRKYFFVYYAIINIVSTLFVAWFNRQMMLNGIGYGVTVILSLQSINYFVVVNKLISITDIFMCLKNGIVFLFLLIIVCVFMDRTIIKIKIRALVSKSYNIQKDVLTDYMQYKPTNSNIMANILTNQTIGMFSLLSNAFNSSGISISSTFDRIVYYVFSQPYIIMLSGFVIKILHVVLLFCFNYIYNSVYYTNAAKFSDNMRRSLCCVPGVPLGEATYKKVDNVSIMCSVIAIFITVVLNICPHLFVLITGTTLYISGIDIMIITSSFLYIINFMQSMYEYNTYVFNVNKIKYYT